LENIIVFNNAHKYSINNEIIQEKELNEVKNFLIKLDKFFNIFNLYKLNARWQLFLDFNNLHATNFPWGKIVAVNLLTNKINYSIPFGYRYFNGKKILGDINFGGILSTNGNIFFATGTPDKKIRAYNSSDGEELWSFTLSSTGTASPMTYMYQGKQYIIVNTSRGKYFGYDNDKENLIIAFSLH
jgi:glucose dehydrogenase